MIRVGVSWERRSSGPPEVGTDGIRQMFGSRPPGHPRVLPQRPVEALGDGGGEDDGGIVFVLGSARAAFLRHGPQNTTSPK